MLPGKVMAECDRCLLRRDGYGTDPFCIASSSLLDNVPYPAEWWRLGCVKDVARARPRGKLARARFSQESALVYVSQPDTVMDACKHSWTPVSCLRKFGSFKFPTSPGKDGWLFFFVKCHLCRDSLKTQPPVPPLNLSQTQVVSLCLCLA